MARPARTRARPPALGASATAADLAGRPAGRPAWIGWAAGEPAYRDDAFASRAAGPATRDRWGDFAARQVRYDVFWGHYEGNVYRSLHRWADALKDDRQLYDHIRTIFSPAYRIGEFWSGHLWGGPLDPDAGDGVARPSALPVATESPKADDLRFAISTLWQYSSWQARKDIATRDGTVKGDVGILVHDDGASVSLRVVDPRTIADLRRDSRGNVKEYVLQEWRPDPEADRLGPFGRRHCLYTEWCRKVGSRVAYTTYRDGAEYDWREYPDGTPESDEVGPEYWVDYDFVPMVFVQHRDSGKGWGWSELQPDFGKLYELDDLASKLSDQIRKLVENPVYIAGADPASLTVDVADDQEGDGSGREKVPTVYGPEGSRVFPLSGSLDITAVAGHIASILEGITLDHPELATDNVGLASSAEARRVAREKVHAMVVQRRAGYDDALVRAHQMAISIGAIRQYEGYEAFDEGSYDRGELDHAIADRPVFAVDRGEKLAEAKSIIDIAKVGRDAGLPVRFALELAGVSDDQIAEVERLMAEEADAATERDVRRQAGMFGAGDPAGEGDGADPSGGPEKPPGETQ